MAVCIWSIIVAISCNYVPSLPSFKQKIDAFLVTSWPWRLRLSQKKMNNSCYIFSVMFAQFMPHKVLRNHFLIFMSLKLIMSFNMIKIHSTFDIGQFVASSRRAIEELIEVFTYNLWKYWFLWRHFCVRCMNFSSSNQSITKFRSTCFIFILNKTIIP